MEMIIGLISGAVGGNAAGALFKNLSLGTLGNSVAGIVGGAVLPSVLNMIGMGGAAETAAGSGMDLGGILTQVAGGAVGGAGTLGIVGLVKNMMNK